MKTFPIFFRHRLPFPVQFGNNAEKNSAVVHVPEMLSHRHHHCLSHEPDLELILVYCCVPLSAPNTSLHSFFLYFPRLDLLFCLISHSYACKYFPSEAEMTWKRNERETDKVFFRHIYSYKKCLEFEYNNFVCHIFAQTLCKSVEEKSAATRS